MILQDNCLGITIKRLLSCRFVIHINACNIIHMMTLKKLLDCTFNNSTLHNQVTSVEEPTN